MDMDPKKDEADESSANGNCGSNGTNEGEGMQEQIEHFDGIQIGSVRGWNFLLKVVLLLIQI
jgi:hypothetical protein